ncbi:MAG TPA: hypothetical protein VMT00_09090 [Thermoanaerobaculia bacterium]|nr:hypothetical protein [Thermoanaerobaculia bacterium]
MRKALALLFAVLIIGAAPAMAVIGFCAKQPCCLPSGDLSFDLESCCGELACDERDVSASETVKKQSPAPAVFAAAGNPLAVTPPRVTDGHEVRTVRSLSERLASLSILLI